MSADGLKHTTYFSSKSRVLKIIPSDSAYVVATALASAAAAYFAAYYLAAGWGLLGFLAAFALGVAIMALEALSYRLAWGRGLHYVTVRRLAAAFAASNFAWFVLLIPAAAARRPAAALLAVFAFWALRSYVVGAVFSNAEPRAASALASALPTPLYNIVLLYRAAPQEALLPSAVGSSVVALSAIGLVILGRGPGAALEALSSFLEAWAGGDGRRLEALMSSKSVRARARGALLRSERFAIAVPYVHPGPFKPVGSYNLPSELFGLLASRYGCGLVLHGPVDHEFNLASNEESRAFARALSEGPRPGHEVCGRLLPPTSVEGERVRLTGLWIGSRALLLVMEPTRGLEDFNGGLLERLEELGSRRGVLVVPVDAHNSLGPDPGDEEESEVLELADRLISAGPQEGAAVARCGCAASPGERWPEIGPGGIAVLSLEDERGNLTALVAVDSNNAAPGFRDSLEARLRSYGFSRAILCTTDTHDSTGPGLRGYLALGESSDGFVDEVARIALSAKESMTSCGDVCVGLVSSEAAFAGRSFLEYARQTASKALGSAKLLLVASLALLVLGYAAVLL